MFLRKNTQNCPLAYIHTNVCAHKCTSAHTHNYTYTNIHIHK